MIVYQSQVSNLEVALDLTSGETVARYGCGEPFARTRVAHHPDDRVMVRYSRAWIASHGWWAYQ